VEEEKVIQLYNFFSDEGYDLGDLNNFKSSLLIDSPQREELYNFFDAEGYDVGEFDNFFLSQQEAMDSGSEGGGSELVTTVEPKTEQFRNTQINRQPQAEKDTAIERAFGKNEVTDFFGDLYRSGVQGINQGATVDDALQLFAQGKSISDEDLQEYVSAVTKMESFGPSEEMQNFTKIYQDEGKGVFGFLKGVFNNPTVLPQLFTSSIASMLNPASLAAGAVGAAGGTAIAPGVGTLAGGIAGISGALETGLAYTEFLKEELDKKGLSFDKEGIRKILEDEDAMDSIQNRSLGRGISIAAIDALTGGLAAGVTRKAALKTSKALAGALGGTVEAVGGATGEAVARGVANQEQDVAEILFEGVTGTATAPISVGLGLSKPPKYKLNGGQATLKQVQTLLNKGTAKEIAATEISIENNPELKKTAETKRQDVLLEQDIKNVYPDLPQEAINELLPLEKRRRALIDNPTKSAKNELIKVDEQIDNINNKYSKDAIQKPSPEEISVQEQSETSTTIREGDTEGTEITGAVTPESQIQDTDKPTQEVEVEAEVSETEVETPNETDITQEDFVELQTLSDPNINELEKNKAFKSVVTRITKKGKTPTRTTASLIKKVKELNVNDPVAVKNVLNQINRVFSKADTRQKIDRVKSLQSSISRKVNKLKDNSKVRTAKEFVLLNPLLSDNLDAFIEQAEKINQGLDKSRVSSQKAVIKIPFNQRQAQSFVTKQQKAERSIKEQEERDSYLLLTGIDPKELTLQEVRQKIRDLQEVSPAQRARIEKKIEKNKANIEKGVTRAFSNFKKAALGRIKKPLGLLTPTQKNIVRDFINIDIDKLETTDQKLEAIDALVNFAVNESTGGMQSIVAKYNGIVEAQRLKDQGISAVPFSFAGRGWLKWLASTPNVFDLIFTSQSKARDVMRAMGFTELTKRAANANRLTQEKITEYVNQYKTKKANGQDYFNEQNAINRGLIAFMRRTVDGTPQEQAAEFNRRKQLVEETIAQLNNSTTKEFNNQGKLYEQAYNKLLSDSNTIEAVESKADPTNLEGVETVTETWRGLRPDLEETGLNVYNISLGEDINYTPDNFTVIEQTKQEELDFNKPFFDPSESEYVYSKETGRLIPSTRPTTLKGKDKKRIVNLSFVSSL